MAPRFHLDENMPLGVAEGLRQRDRECSVPKEVGLISASDEKHVEFALGEDRIIITRDDDYIAFDAEGLLHAGIIYWTEKRHFGQLIKDIDALCFEKTPEELRGGVFYL